MHNKQRIKSLLYGFEVRSTAAIVNGLVHHTPKQTTLKIIRRDLAKTSEHIRLSRAELNALWLGAYSRYQRISKKTYSELRKSNKNYKEDLENRQNVVYLATKSYLSVLEQTKNTVADMIEHREKHNEITDLLSNGVFYLCSEHKNPAKDHENYQGKVYISEDWEKRIVGNQEDVDKLRARIKAYVKNKGILTVEEVVWNPPYLCTRKNCKHYLIEVPVEEVLGASAKSLVKRHELLVDNKIPISEAKRAYLGYYERLKTLVALKQMCKSSELDKDISKTRKLCLKWASRARSD